MQIFANGKQRFDSFMEFYVIHLKYQGVKSSEQSKTQSFTILDNFYENITSLLVKFNSLPWN